MTSPRMTWADAINTCLLRVSEDTLNDVETEGGGVAANAGLLLTGVSRVVQSQGWYWNTETRRLLPDVNGSITLPLNTIRADTKKGRFADTDVVVRGDRLFNKTKSSYKFSSPIELELVVFLEWQELPSEAQSYIAQRAARGLFESEVLGGEPSRPNLEEVQALAALNRKEMEDADYNMVQSEDVARVVLRDFDWPTRNY